MELVVGTTERKKRESDCDLIGCVIWAFSNGASLGIPKATSVFKPNTNNYFDIF